MPFTLPGETVDDRAARQRGRVSLEVVAPSPERVAPVCRHFGTLRRLRAPAHGAQRPISPGSGRSSARASRSRASRRRSSRCRGRARTRAAARSSPRSRRRGVVLGFQRRGSHEIIADRGMPGARARDRRRASRMLRAIAGARGASPATGAYHRARRRQRPRHRHQRRRPAGRAPAVGARPPRRRCRHWPA